MAAVTKAKSANPPPPVPQTDHGFEVVNEEPEMTVHHVAQEIHARLQTRVSELTTLGNSDQAAVTLAIAEFTHLAQGIPIQESAMNEVIQSIYRHD